MWRFESVHSFGSVGNLYQKMHFVGSNLSTGSKSPKCIYKISKNFRVEKNGEISRNLRFSLVFVPASKSDTHHGWGSRIRTYECQSQSLVPYRLAIPQYSLFHEHSNYTISFSNCQAFSSLDFVFFKKVRGRNLQREISSPQASFLQISLQYRSARYPVPGISGRRHTESQAVQ